jgi:hypothetical protein
MFKILFTTFRLSRAVHAFTSDRQQRISERNAVNVFCMKQAVTINRKDQKNMRIQSRVTSFAAAIVLLLQIVPAAWAERAEENDKHNTPVITFTKWITTPPLMAGITGGDAVGLFVGEVLNSKPTTNPNLVNSISWIEAVYEVHSGNRSFTALIRGGNNTTTGAAVLDGVILGGWRTGDRVRVEFNVVNGCGQVGAYLDRCFQGTIRILSSDDD